MKLIEKDKKKIINLTNPLLVNSWKTFNFISSLEKSLFNKILYMDLNSAKKENEQLQKTTIPSLQKVSREWYFLDLKDKIVGKESAKKIVDLLRGKNRRDFTYNSDLGNHVVLINARRINFTGNKLDKKNYYNHSGYPGGLRTRSTRLMLEKYPTELAFRIIRGMIPHNKLGDRQAKRLFIFAEEKHNLEAQAKNFIKITID